MRAAGKAAAVGAATVVAVVEERVVVERAAAVVAAAAVTAAARAVTEMSSRPRPCPHLHRGPEPMLDWFQPFAAALPWVTCL